MLCPFSKYDTAASGQVDSYTITVYHRRLVRPTESKVTRCGVNRAANGHVVKRRVARFVDVPANVPGAVPG